MSDKSDYWTCEYPQRPLWSIISSIDPVMLKVKLKYSLISIYWDLHICNDSTLCFKNTESQYAMISHCVLRTKIICGKSIVILFLVYFNILTILE